MELWAHQKAALERIEKQEATMIDYGMGTGKSRVIVEYVKRHRPARTLIVCPLSVCDVWPYQFKKHGYTEPLTVLNRKSVSTRAQLLSVGLECRRLEGRPAIVVVNYDSIWRQPLAKILGDTQWDLVVLDESHRIKDVMGRASRYCWRVLTRNSRKRVCMTGTMLPHSPEDILGQYAFLDQRIFGTYKGGFRRRYAIMGGYQNKQPIGWRDEADMRAKIQSIAITAKTSDVIDLPPVQDIDFPVVLPEKALKVYRSIERDLLAETDAGTITAANALVKVLRMQQVTSGVMETDGDATVELHSEKRRALEDLLESIPASEPVVVFAKFHPDLDQIHKAAEKLGGSRELSGRRDKRQLKEWQDGEARVLALQYQAGGLGVDLTRAHYGVFFSMTFAAGDYEQSRARAHRPGQEEHVWYYHLVAQGLIDEKIYAAVKRKQDVVKYVLTGIRERRHRGTRDDSGSLSKVDSRS